MVSHFNSFLMMLSAFVSLLLPAFGGVASSANLASQEEALRIIADFADRLCKSPPLKGSATDLELSGSAKAELNEVIKKVVGLGIEGAAKYKGSEYQGVLQKDLTNLLQDSAKCRIEVFRELKDKLLPKERLGSLTEKMVEECGLEQNVTVEIEAYNTITFIRGQERRGFEASSREIPNIIRFLDGNRANVRASEKTPGCMERYLSRIFSTVPGYQERIYVLGFPYLRGNASRKDIELRLDGDRRQPRLESNEDAQEGALRKTLKEQRVKLEEQDQIIQRQERTILALKERLQAGIPVPGADDSRGRLGREPTGCVVTIRNSLVPLKEKPEPFSRDLSKVRPGDYNILNFVRTKWGLAEDGWFQIESEGRTGWIVDNTWSIEEKTRACP